MRRVCKARGSIGGPEFVSVDVDVLDPAFAPGTGTPEPGGMTPGDLMWAAREIGAHVIPQQVGTLDMTGVAAGRLRRAARWQSIPAQHGRYAAPAGPALG